MTISKQTRLSYTAKAKEIVEQMTLEQKVHLMSGKVSMDELLEHLYSTEIHYNWIPYETGDCPEFGVPPIKFVDGPRGVVCGFDSTCFPVSMGRGATFDPELEERIGSVIGREVRAHGGNFFGGVCINMPYNPGWGRSQETYGEDSFLLGEMGKAIVRGVQYHNVLACVKHFAFNSMECARFNVSVEADKRTEREIYLPHFKECIDVGAASIMSAYNKYQGTHCGHSHYLLTEVLKGEWDFDGIIISDFAWGIKDTVEAANGGMDVEMCHTLYFGDKLVEAVRRGDVPESRIDDAALRIVRTLFAFTEAQDPEDYPRSIVGSEQHIALALEAAEKSMTLIKNDQVLPLVKEKVNTLLVLGKLGNVLNIGDHGSSQVHPKYGVTPLQGFENLLGAERIIFDNGSDVEKAKQLASEADAVVIVAGYSYGDEGEYIEPVNNDDLGEPFGGDRVHSLGLHQEQIELIKAVGSVNKQSTVVLIGGNMIMVEEWQSSVGAILMAYYPGMEGGTAIAKTIFGEVNPGGKLPFVIPASESDVPQIDWFADTQQYSYYHGYALLDKLGKQPSYPFGHGLSYTAFNIGDVSLQVNDGIITASCAVKNIGELQGDEVIQLYIGYSQSRIDRPVKSLKGFKRVTLAPGEAKQVVIELPVEKLQWYNAQSNQWELEAMSYDYYMGTSSSEQDLICGKFQL